MADAMWFQRDCEKCGERFPSRRADKRFCSSSCKSKNHREQDARTVRVIAAERAFDRLVEVADTEALEEFEAYVTRTVRVRREGAGQ